MDIDEFVQFRIGAGWFAFIMAAMLDYSLYHAGYEPLWLWLVAGEVMAILISIWLPHYVFPVLASMFFCAVIGGGVGAYLDFTAPDARVEFFNVPLSWQRSCFGVVVGELLGIPLGVIALLVWVDLCKQQSLRN